MARKSIEVPYVPRLIKKLEQILIENRVIRRSIIKGDTLEAFGEAGIKAFYIILDEVLDDEKAILIIDANNKHSLDILTGLVETKVEELYQEHKEREEIRKILANRDTKKGDKKDKIEIKCSACSGELTDLGIKKLADNLKARIWVCQECERLEFYKE